MAPSEQRTQPCHRQSLEEEEEEESVREKVREEQQGGGGGGGLLPTWSACEPVGFVGGVYLMMHKVQRYSRLLGDVWPRLPPETLEVEG